eukprot:scaffold375_cov200-Alexandrium_tamarense.AAC.16
MQTGHTSQRHSTIDLPSILAMIVAELPSSNSGQFTTLYLSSFRRVFEMDGWIDDCGGGVGGTEDGEVGQCGDVGGCATDC